MASKSPRYRCRKCSAPHGGVFSGNVCHRCIEQLGSSIRLKQDQVICKTCGQRAKDLGTKFNCMCGVVSFP